MHSCLTSNNVLINKIATVLLFCHLNVHVKTSGQLFAELLDAPVHEGIGSERERVLAEVSDYALSWCRNMRIFDRVAEQGKSNLAGMPFTAAVLRPAMPVPSPPRSEARAASIRCLLTASRRQAQRGLFAGGCPRPREKLGRR